ncbi:MAG: hypothetical protein R3D57_15985 [Hyphomicrobiaceae bacterium]
MAAIAAAAVSGTHLQELIDRQPADHSLLQPFQQSPDLDRLDLERFVYRHWHCAGHVRQVPRTGDCFLFDIRPRDQWALKAVPGQKADCCTRLSMFGGAVTASEDGKPVAPLMRRFKDGDGDFTIFYLDPLNHFLAYADDGAIFCYKPRAVDQTELHITGFVWGDATEGTDLDKARPTWMWRVTTAADKRIVGENAMGVASRYHRPGPNALPIESHARRLSESCLSELGGKQ